MLSNCYYFGMNEHETSARGVADLIVHLGRVAAGDGFISGLTAVQWTTLRYFARANRFSRTVSAFAEFHATTRGTASQTIKGLVADHYLTRTPSESDGRSTRLELTDKARAILADDPFESLVQAAATLPPGGREVLAGNLERMLRYVAGERGKRPFGVCPSCAYLESESARRETRPGHKCGLMRQRLEAAELDQICVNFESGKDFAPQRTLGPKNPR